MREYVEYLFHTSADTQGCDDIFDDGEAITILRKTLPTLIQTNATMKRRIWNERNAFLRRHVKHTETQMSRAMFWGLATLCTDVQDFFGRLFSVYSAKGFIFRRI